MRKLGAAEVQIRQAIRGMATQKQKLKLLSNYQKQVRQQIGGLRSTAWPVVPDTDWQSPAIIQLFIPESYAPRRRPALRPESGR